MTEDISILKDLLYQYFNNGDIELEEIINLLTKINHNDELDYYIMRPVMYYIEEMDYCNDMDYNTLIPKLENELMLLYDYLLTM